MPAPGFWSGSTVVDSSGDADIDALLGGTRWTGPSITYSFPSRGAIWGTSPSTAYGASGEPWSAAYEPLSESDRGYFTSAIQQWANVANLQVTLVADTTTSVGDIRAAYSGGDDSTQAWAYLPDNTAIAGDIWFNTFGTSASEVWTTGSYEYLTVLHELGHALGLKHPFEGTAVLPLGLDSKSFTVMSYSGENGNHSTRMSFYPTTPMILDIDAMQYMYGANTAYHAGNDSYAYSDATYYNETIWDGGGTDTLAYTGTVSSDIDLRAGVQYGSSIGLPVYITSRSGATLHPIHNVWIADGVVIENAAGGSGNDTLTGNNAANVLDGSAGADSMLGGAGNDTYVLSGADQIVENAGEGTDLILSDRTYSLLSAPNVENLSLYGNAAATVGGSDARNILTGNNAANALNGLAGADVLKGMDGFDTLRGGDGADTLYGGFGDDRLKGNSGADRFVFDSALSASGNTDTIIDFKVAEHDKIWLDNDIFTALGTQTATTKLPAGRFSGDGVAHDSNDNIVYDPSTGVLTYDSNGNQPGGSTVIAIIGTTVHPVLHYTDFQIIG